MSNDEMTPCANCGHDIDRHEGWGIGCTHAAERTTGTGSDSDCRCSVVGPEAQAEEAASRAAYAARDAGSVGYRR